MSLIDNDMWEQFVASLLRTHYDEAYRRSRARNLNLATSSHCDTSFAETIDVPTYLRIAKELVAATSMR